MPKHYTNVTENYGIIPNSEHHSCMIVALGCVRQFDKAISVIKMIQLSDYSSVWPAVLGACSKWGNVNLGSLAFASELQALFRNRSNRFEEGNEGEDPRHSGGIHTSGGSQDR